METKENIVVYTGSFNPPTKAHFALMEEAMKVVNASKGIFLPTCEDHIKKKMIAKMDPLSLSGEVRIKMLETFSKHNKLLSVNDYEIRMKDSDSTYKTFSYLKKENGDANIYYVMGADKLKNLPHWKHANEFLNEFKFVVFDRSDLDAKTMIEKDQTLRLYQDNFVIVPSLEHLSQVSSSKVRKMFLDGDDRYKDYLSEEVVEILENLDLSKYPPVDEYDFIHLKLSGGPHDLTAACRKVYLMNKELFENVPKFKNIGEVKLINEEKDKLKVKKFETRIHFVDQEYYELAKEYDNLLVISETSASRVAHMYDQGGASSLDEELCRISSLSQALYRFGDPKLKCVKEFGDFEKNLYPLSEPLLIKDLTLIRFGKKNDYRLLPSLDQTFSVLLVPSLNLTTKDKINDLELSLEGRLNQVGFEIMKKRLNKALLGALDNGFENIVINAFGSGFHIELRDSALLIKEMIKEFDGCFKNIIINEKKKGKVTKNFYPLLEGEIM